MQLLLMMDTDNCCMHTLLKMSTMQHNYRNLLKSSYTHWYDCSQFLLNNQHDQEGKTI